MSTTEDDKRLYSRYSIEYGAENAHTRFGHFANNPGAAQEEASCGMRNKVVDR